MTQFFTPSLRALSVAILFFVATTLRGAEPQVAEGLVDFQSKSGKFSVLLPGKPEHEVTEVGNDKEKQHQFKVGTEQGVYLVSFQDNPNLEGGTPKQMAAALVVGRDSLIKLFRGELLDSQEVALDKEHPGLNFRVTIPQAKGEARCRFYMVGTRLYQIMAIGVPEFANSEQSTEVIESFKLLQ